MMRAISGAILALALGACGGDDYDIPMTTLAGTVGGQSWTFVAGDTDAFLSEGDDSFFSSLFPEAFTACGFGAPAADKFLLVRVPKTVGEYEFSFSQNMTFVLDGNENLIATKGRIVVDEVSATLVRGGLHGVFDDDNEVSGRFELTICADTQ